MAIGQGFLNGIEWWGTIRAKWPNCMKMTKSAFLGQNSEGTWGDKSIFQVVGGISPSPPSPPSPSN